MQWLIANMWMALAATTILGLLFGASFRGLLASSSVRRARAERDIAQTELAQSKDEIDALFAAQRKRKEETAQAVSGDGDLRAELDDRETRITALGDELAAAQAELEQLKTAKDAEPDPAPLAEADNQELVQLRDRNTWLEERVGALETDLSAVPDVAAAVPVAEPEANDSDLAKEKLAWQAAYLRQRVDALETKIIQKDADTIVEPVAEQMAAPVATLVEVAQVDDTTDEPERSEADEELARLRWRNRYLEGRLAYFEQAPEESEDDAEAALVADDVAELEVEVEPAPEPIDEPEVELEVAPEVTEPEPEADPDVHPSEAMLAELEGAQPEQIDRPTNGGDDLTQITGIGPRIAEVLNGLGIWTYAQVAEWQPEHETWIENHLAFKGRVGRENWVGQAKDLLVDA
ncbi:MAG: hypothetical protein AAFO74_16125 [Pseudomonadota bacterium]